MLKLIKQFLFGYQPLPPGKEKLFLNHIWVANKDKTNG